MVPAILPGNFPLVGIGSWWVENPLKEIRKARFIKTIIYLIPFIYSGLGKITTEFNPFFKPSGFPEIPSVPLSIKASNFFGKRSENCIDRVATSFRLGWGSPDLPNFFLETWGAGCVAPIFPD